MLRGAMAPSPVEILATVFFGLAVQAYEATLVSDDSPVDRFLAGETGALTAAPALFSGQSR